MLCILSCNLINFINNLNFFYIFLKKVTAIESALSIKKNLKNPNLLTFSEQQIIDCSYRLYYNKTTKSYSNLGCNGGYLYNTLYYTMTKGLLNNNYASKYAGEVQKCEYKSSDSVTKINGIFSASLKVGDYEAMKRAVAQQPIMTHMYVASDFYNYQTGRFFLIFKIKYFFLNDQNTKRNIFEQIM